LAGYSTLKRILLSLWKNSKKKIKLFLLHEFCLVLKFIQPPLPHDLFDEGFVCKCLDRERKQRGFGFFEGE
jgi:hypothetical protein